MNYLRDTEVVSSSVESIGPEIADIMLKRNFANRKINTKRIAQYSSTMSNGEWKLTGQPIIVSEDGHIIDGQHRLMAVVASGATISVLLVKVRAVDGRGELTALNVPIDIGHPRTASDVTGINSREVAIVRTMIHYFEEGGQSLTLRPEIIIDRHKKIGSVVPKYSKISSTRRTRASAMVGFIMADISGFDCFDMVTNVSLSRYESLTPIWGSYIRASDRITDISGSGYVKPSMAYAWRVKDATGDILRVFNIDQAIEEMAELYNAVINGERIIAKEEDVG